MEKDNKDERTIPLSPTDEQPGLNTENKESKMAVPGNYTAVESDSAVPKKQTVFNIALLVGLFGLFQLLSSGLLSKPISDGVGSKWGAAVNSMPLAFLVGITIVLSNMGYIWLKGDEPFPAAAKSNWLLMPTILIGVISTGLNYYLLTQIMAIDLISATYITVAIGAIIDLVYFKDIVRIIDLASWIVAIVGAIFVLASSTSASLSTNLLVTLCGLITGAYNSMSRGLSKTIEPIYIITYTQGAVVLLSPAVFILMVGKEDFSLQLNTGLYIVGITIVGAAASWALRFALTRAKSYARVGGYLFSIFPAALLLDMKIREESIDKLTLVHILAYAVLTASFALFAVARCLLQD